MTNPTNPTQGSTKQAMPVGRPWPKGVSGNPGGRAKSIRKVIAQEAMGKDPAEIVRFMFSLMRGEVKINRGKGKPAGLPEHRERRLAAEWLGEQFFGKAVQAVELSGPEGEPVAFDLKRLTNEQLDQLSALAATAAAVEQDPSGEGAPEDV